MSIKVAVVDDSLLYRRVIVDVLQKIDDVEVVGQFASGKAFLNKVKELSPDIITLDLEMPEMDGLSVLTELKKEKINSFVIIVSSHSVKGSTLTIKALDKGAFDFITKPQGKSAEDSKEFILKELSPLFTALKHRVSIRNIFSKSSSSFEKDSVVNNISTTIENNRVSNSLGVLDKIINKSKVEMILIGVSTGGPGALAQIIPQIKPNLGLPIIIVQHMPPIFTKTLADSLNDKTSLSVVEVENNMSVVPNTIYIAPGGKQMKIINSLAGEKKLMITDDPPENNCKPSVDYLFRSASLNFPGKSVAFIMTGMGNDGTMGLKLLKRNGTYVYAQNEETCVVFGMPKIAIEANVVDEVIPLGAIAEKINLLGK
ncbi:MAG: chemotaxis-specific protein-glutamate methyltransferase CheB [Candidatus Delongbacteria bacterium]|nr:chemotaxis-specific protein-glutamate methyltransferase CheB [Candidatus Delongbacteria bacterium]MBN2833537.1 chemotaxis-specific protein-glutamate methyltransferase CheB [Candidatus Delongbacteria bacterium]